MTLRGRLHLLSALLLCTVYDRSNSGFSFGESYRIDPDLHRMKMKRYADLEKKRKRQLTPKQKKARNRSKRAKQARKRNRENRSYQLKQFCNRNKPNHKDK